MRVKVRKKPAPAVVSGERAKVTADIPFLTEDISGYCVHRKHSQMIKEAVRNAVNNLPKTFVFDQGSDFKGGMQ